MQKHPLFCKKWKRGTKLDGYYFGTREVMLPRGPTKIHIFRLLEDQNFVSVWGTSQLDSKLRHRNLGECLTVEYAGVADTNMKQWQVDTYTDECQMCNNDADAKYNCGSCNGTGKQGV